jgi:hypothetical protein
LAIALSQRQPFITGASDNLIEGSRMTWLRRLTTTLLLLFCLVPLGKPLGMVLCFGADGHIAFEPAHDQAHGTAAPDVRGPLCPQMAETFARIDRSVPCTDVAFFASDSGGQLIPASDTRPRLDAPVSAPVLLVVPSPSELPAPLILAECPLPGNHPLTILRSVVLHI